MPNIRVDLSSAPINGQPLTFRSPADCSQVEGLKVHYPENGTETSETFQFADAHGNNVGSIGLFAENVLVKVILDTELERAYVQNADTNAYLEARFNMLGIESAEHPGCFYRMVGEVREWINPPMVPGVEYRTTERKDGKVVYTKAVDCGGPGFDKEVTYTGGTNVVRYYGNLEDIPLPYTTTGSYTDRLAIGVSVGPSKITIHCGEGRVGWGYVIVTVFYTKD